MHIMMSARLPLAALGLLLLSACSPNNQGATPATPISAEEVPAATPLATCGPGSRPETGMQGRVSREDHTSGRASEGYTCNTEIVGSYATPNALGTVGGFKVERYTDAAGHDCAYYDTTLLFPTNIIDTLGGGVNVLDMSDPTKPVLTAKLMTPAMLSPHESLLVNQKRGVLAAVMGNPAFGPGVVDIYDISQDCRRPVLKSVAPVGTLGHESGFSPDGMTFYSASPGTPTLTPIDLTNLSVPLPLTILQIASHGVSISDDGNRAYLSTSDGLKILDVSEIQARKPSPKAPEISALSWPSISIPQNTMPITIKGKPYLVEIDEYTDALNGGPGNIGAGRIIDISDETKPKVISNLRLQVHQPENKAARDGDPGANLPVQGYGGHYCNVPSRVDPTIVACSMIISGLRIFDIRDPYHPREVAYFNAPVSPRLILEASNWAMSSPSFVPERKEIWYSDGYSGFYAIRVTNNAWPDK
ncbi:MAG: hypothetical protein AABY68_09935 [Pseudomonadota bacterium]